MKAKPHLAKFSTPVPQLNLKFPANESIVISGLRHATTIITKNANNNRASGFVTSMLSDRTKKLLEKVEAIEARRSNHGAALAVQEESGVSDSNDSQFNIPPSELVSGNRDNIEENVVA